MLGGGWAGLAAAITATQQGAEVTVWEMAPTVGGRAKSFTSPDGHQRDNGQHLLIGAYTECLRLMKLVGLAPEQILLRAPLDLRFHSGAGLRLPRIQPQILSESLRRLDRFLPNLGLSQIQLALGLLVSGQGPKSEAWIWQDRWGLAKESTQWQRHAWQCPATQTVADLSASLPPKIVNDLLEPLCITALNTPMAQASGQVFLRVLQEALLGPLGSSDLLIPRVPLNQLWPHAAQKWLQQKGALVHAHRRALSITKEASNWMVHSAAGPAFFDGVVLACPPQEAARLLPAGLNPGWQAVAKGLEFEAIATVYAQVQAVGTKTYHLSRPLVALRSSPQAPAQFALDRGQLGGPQGELALVVSACQPMEREQLTQAVLAQAQKQLSCPTLHPIQTLIEKRATFACTAGLQRPTMDMAPGLWACGDYVQGPFPATLEGAVRSGVAAAQQAVTSFLG